MKVRARPRSTPGWTRCARRIGRLDQRIAQIAAEGSRDEVELQRLKKQKLALKDRIAHLESDRIPDIIA